MLEDDEEGEDSKSKASAVIDDLVSKARQKLDELPHIDNPLYKLKEKTEHYEKTGESDAARQRLKDRYSNEAVLGKKMMLVEKQEKEVRTKPHEHGGKAPSSGIAEQLVASLTGSKKAHAGGRF